MAKDNKINLPSGSGGVVRYFDQSISKIEFTPQSLVAVCVIIILVFIIWHLFRVGVF